MIRKLLAGATASALMLTFLFNQEAQAQSKPLACQFIATAGLDWQSGRWNGAHYAVSEPFVLILRDGEIDPKSAEKPLSTEEGFVVCDKPRGARLISCFDRVGG